VKALDTNILVRFLVRDNQEQAERVYRLFKAAEADKTLFFVSIPVLLELIWVLDSVYGITRHDILNAIDEFLLLPIVSFDGQSAVRRFIAEARNNNLDLSDLLIACDSTLSGCDKVLTFDKKVAKSELFTLLEK